MNRTARRAVLAPVSLLVSAVLTATGLVLATPAAVAAPDPATGSAPVEDRSSAMVTTDPLPTAQINGVVYSQVVAGSTVFAAGSFSKGRPAGAAPGKKEVKRQNFIGYSLSTGTMRAWAPSFNGTVRQLALSSDRKTLYVVGDFTKVGSVTRNRFAAFDIAKRRLRPAAPVFNQQVTSVHVLDKTVYVGGWFTTVDGNPRTRLAALTSSGALVRDWAPVANGTTSAIVATPDKKRVVVGGNFTTLNGVDANGMGSLDARTGATQPWKINQVVRNGGSGASVTSLRADRTTIYGSAYAYRGSRDFEGAFAADPADGSVKWLQDCHGDTYDVAPVGAVLYSAGHAHDCVNIGGFPDTRSTSARYRALAVSTAAKGVVSRTPQSETLFPDFTGLPSPALHNWFPYLAAGTYTGQNQAAWSLASTSRYLLLGGEFTKVGSTAQQGLVRLGVPGKVKAVRSKQAPEPFAGRPVVKAATATTATVTTPTTFDRDNLALRYELVLGTKVVGRARRSAPFWEKGSVDLKASGLKAGRRYTFTVRAVDGDGNRRTNATVSLYTPSAYAERVLSDGATHQWRLDSEVATDPDRAGDLPLSLAAGVTLGAKGAVSGDADPAATFAGRDDTLARTLSNDQGGTGSSIELWFSTTRDDNGLARFRPDGSQVYVRDLRTVGGRVQYTVESADASSRVTLTSPTTYDDGRYHHVVATQSGSTVTLYVDGRAVAEGTGAPELSVSGRWGIGAQLAGSLDEVATYATALSSGQVVEHHGLARG